MRPIVEALFFERNDLFEVLINRLVNANNDRLYKAFIDSLSGTDLSQTMLFSWSPEMRLSALKEAAALGDYGSTLVADENDEIGYNKGRRLSSIGRSLFQNISKQMRFSNENTDDNNKI